MAALAQPLPWIGEHSALDPSGTASKHVASLWWAMFWTSLVVYVIVMIALGYAAFRRRTNAPADATSSERLTPAPRSVHLTVGIATGVTVLILFIVVVTDFFTARAIATPATGAVHIKIIARQWWWYAVYSGDTVPQQQLSVANEIHVPVGKPIVFTLTSRDVIHSFWVPNLNGKTDAVPGYESNAWFRADTPGVYRGQCAEFCGLEHAKMAFTIVAESEEQYNKWYQAQLAPAVPTTDSLRSQGERVFMTGTCSSCHAIRGTGAGGTLGPELTHLASQRTIAAGTLQNTPDNLARWILDAQRIKPGAAMPSQELSSRDLNVLVAYLEGLR